MSDVQGAAPAVAPSPAAAPETGPLTLSQAVRSYTAKREKESEAASGGDTPVEPIQKSPPESDAGPATVPGETEKADQTVEPSPIEPPRSWSKEDKELFKGLPRETQERLADRERSRESDFLRRQNDAAEKLKGLTSKEQALEQARTHYESGLANMQGLLQGQIAGEFADVKTMADVQKMATEDWPRYIKWDAAQKQLAAVVQEKQAADARQAKEASDRLSAFHVEQDRLFSEKAPELADKTASAKASDAAHKLMNELGFTDAELGASWNGSEKFSIRDHRVQLLIRDALRYREASAKAKVPAAKPVPTVQQPGVARPAGAADADRIEALSKRLDKTGDIRVAAQLLAARRAARNA